MVRADNSSDPVTFIIGKKSIIYSWLSWYNMLCNLPNCYIGHPNNRLGFQKGMYHAIYHMSGYIICYIAKSYVYVSMRGQQQLLQTLKHPVFVLASQTSASKAREWPQELGCWSSSLNLLLPSRTAFEIDGQMTGRGSNLDSNLNSATWPTSCEGFLAVWSLNFFLSQLLMPNLSQVK